MEGVWNRHYSTVDENLAEFPKDLLTFVLAYRTAIKETPCSPAPEHTSVETKCVYHCANYLAAIRGS